jgi:hypothetical protein
MKAIQVSKPGGGLELVDPPTSRDAMIKEGHWPGLKYPRIPG